MIGLLAGVSSAASAASTTVHVHPTPGLGNMTGTLSGTAPLELFNSNLGTLGSVLIVTNFTAASSSADSSMGNLKWTSGTSSTSTNVHPVATSTASVTGGPAQLAGAAIIAAVADMATHKIGGNTDTPFIATGSNSISTTISTPAGDWKAAGGGTDLLAYSIGTTSNLTPGSFTLDWPGNGPWFDYAIDITYNYTPRTDGPGAAPEPASLLVLGAGLATLGGIRRRRRASKGAGGSPPP